MLSASPGLTLPRESSPGRGLTTTIVSTFSTTPRFCRSTRHITDVNNAPDWLTTTHLPRPLGGWFATSYRMFIDGDGVGRLGRGTTLRRAVEESLRGYQGDSHRLA